MIENRTAAAETLIEIQTRTIDDDPDRVVVVVMPKICRRFIIAKPIGDPLSPYQFPDLVRRLCELPELLENTPVAITLKPVDTLLLAHGGVTDHDYGVPTDLPAPLLHEITILSSGAVSQRDGTIYLLVVEDPGDDR